jgi:hypothetical protein
MPFRPSSVVVHPKAQPKLDRIEAAAARRRQPEQAIWKAFQTSVARVKSDGQWGEVIPSNSIPRSYCESLGVSNLYCVDLPSFHRLFYTIRNRDVVIIDLVDHQEYDRLMGV